MPGRWSVVDVIAGAEDAGRMIELISPQKLNRNERLALEIAFDP